MSSRYYITREHLTAAALNLQLGEGISQRMAGVDPTEFISRAEEWAEDQISDYLGIPLKPTPRRGEKTLGTITDRNFPQEFIQAIIYWTVSRILHSEFFESEPNRSESAQWAEETAKMHLMEFRSRTSVMVGAGRRRHPNVHMPPNVAPKENYEPNQSRLG